MRKSNKILLIVVFGASMLTFFVSGIQHSFGLYLVPITEYLNIGREAFGFAFALQVFVAGFGAFFFGALSDKYGSGITAFIGSLLFISGLLWFANTSSSFDIVGSQILIGLGAAGAGTSVVLGAVGRAAKEKNRTFYLGVVMAGGSLGQFVILPITTLLIDRFQWSMSMIYLSYISALMLILSFALNYSGKSESSIVGTKQSIKGALNEALRSRSFLLLTLGFFVCGFHVTFVAVHLPAYINDQNLPAWVGGWALALIGLFNIVGTLLFGYLGDHGSKKNLLALLYFLRGFLFLLFIYLPKTELIVLLFASLLGILWLATVPLTSGIITVIFGPYYMSMLFGIVFFSHQVGSFLGSWLGGKFFDIYGSYDIMWWLCVILGFLSGLIHAPIKEFPISRILNKTQNI
jgi:MFS family permease